MLPFKLKNCTFVTAPSSQSNVSSSSRGIQVTPFPRNQQSADSQDHFRPITATPAGLKNLLLQNFNLALRYPVITIYLHTKCPARSCCREVEKLNKFGLSRFNCVFMQFFVLRLSTGSLALRHRICVLNRCIFYFLGRRQRACLNSRYLPNPVWQFPRIYTGH